MSLITPFGVRYNRKTKKYEETSKITPTFEYDFPDGFVIIRDTREQTGLFVKPPKGLLIVRDTLKYGDYSIKGFEGSIAVERKNIDDLWTSVTVSAEDFKRKMTVLAGYERAWLLIDGLESEYLSFREERKIHPNQIRQALASIEGRIGVPIHQSESIAHSERWVIDVFVKYFCEKRGL
jgi:ERCC4-type nuclease